jgi:short-subunit dehydrogenase
MNIRGKNVILTGATGGIGRAAAERLAGAGAHLLLTARNGERLERLARQLRSTGGVISTLSADISTDAGREALHAAARCLPSVDVLINNAGVAHFGKFACQPAESIVDQVNTNVVAPMLLVHDLLPLLSRSPGSAILNVGSILGSIGLPGQVTYAATKFALHGFSEALRRELHGHDIRVLYLAPRSTDTGMNSDTLRELNAQLGIATDNPSLVAERLVAALQKTPREQFIGWPERLFVKLNALLPALVDFGTRKQRRLLDDAQLVTTLTTLPNGAKQ